MARSGKPPIREQDLEGFKYFDRVQELLIRLHEDGVDPSGNRVLHFDQYVALLLFYFLNPVLSSLRGLQQCTQLDKVQKLVTAPREGFSLTTLSEAAPAFDPQRLREVFVELAQEVTDQLPPKDAQALQGLVAVDGTLLRALPKMAWALWQDNQNRAAKAHVHFDVVQGIPTQATRTVGNGSEVAQLKETVQAGHLYVLDRGYASYSLFRTILDAGSSLIARVKERVAYTWQQELPLSDEDRAAGVIRDIIIGRLGTEHHKDELKRPMRLVWIQTEKKKKDGTPEVLVLCTDRIDLSAAQVALGYQKRWQIELFFRWFKCILGCRHLISHSQEGVEHQLYAALIASLLITLWTGQKPNKRLYEMICFYLSGLASLNELMAAIEKQKLKQQKNVPRK